ncbi:MAG: class I SAM-dependent methyltransferase, partial [Myxococcota bacterium]
MSERERARQREHFARSDAAHFEWQTAGAYVADSEAALLAAVPRLATGRLLEIGCGDGGNLHHLAGRSPMLVGVDFSIDKLRFARRRVPHARFVCSDGACLPVRSGSLDGVLIRDVLHHAADRRSVLDEAKRVLRPGGTLTVIEPNGRSPLVMLQGLLVRAERGAWRFGGARLAGEIRDAGFEVLTSEARQALGFHRVLLHHAMGAP